MSAYPPGGLGALGRALAVVTLRPFDTSTEEGRSLERYRRAALTSLATGLGRSISIVTILVTIPLALNYLGPERFGLWATMVSLVGLLSFADAGLGNGLVTALAGAHGREDVESARQFVSSAFAILCGLAFALAIAFGVAYAWVPWDSVYNVSPGFRSEAEAGSVVLVLCLLGGLVVGIAEDVQLGYQEGFINGLWALVGNLLALAGTLAAIAVKARVPWLVLAFAGAPVVTGAVNAVVLFGWRRPWLRPRLTSVGRTAARAMLQLGVFFFLLQLGGMVIFAADNLIVAQVFGAKAVTDYVVPMRLFAVAPMVLAILLGPLWPAYGEALARREVAWAKRTLLRSMLGVLGVAGFASAALVVFGRPIIHAWVGREVTPSWLLLLGFAIWAVIWSVGNALAMFLNGANIVRLQVITAVVTAVSVTLVKIFLGRAIGLSGVVWGTVVGYVVLTCVPFAIAIPRILRQAEVDRR
jgi:O-antigen/teichoic acid export membrane protein